MLALAMLLQDASTATGDSHWMVTWMGVIALSLAAIALVLVIGGIVAAALVTKALKEVSGTIAEVRKDLRSSTEEIKNKVYPLVDGLTHVGKTAQTMLDDAAPKISTITTHLVETSRVVRDSAEKLSGTVTDANQKTQRQVARVDGMVTAALNTTAEMAATIEHGIKVPARKIAEAATQARVIAEGVLEKIKGMASNLPFMQHQRVAPRPSRSSGSAAYRASAPQTPTTPASATGTVPLVK